MVYENVDGSGTEEENKQNNQQNQDRNFVLEQKSNFEITKNTKGFNFSFKIVENDLEALKDQTREMDDFAFNEIKRLTEMFKELDSGGIKK